MMIDSSFRNVDVSELFSWNNVINKAFKIQRWWIEHKRNSLEQRFVFILNSGCNLTALLNSSSTKNNSEISTFLKLLSIIINLLFKKSNTLYQYNE